MGALGLALGSFLSVVAHRVPRGESVVSPRSRCSTCGTQIAAYDNVPVISWALLRGRCRHCSERIPLTYPLLELGLGASFIGALLAFGDEPIELGLACALAATLLAVTLTDLEHRIIPNKILIASALVGAAILVTDPPELVEHGIAAAAAFALLLVVALAYPRGMGMGDVKLAAVMGLYLGRAVAPALLIGFAAGAVYGLALIARHGSGARKQAVPFGPFLAFGGLVAIFAGDEIVNWYLDSFIDS